MSSAATMGLLLSTVLSQTINGGNNLSPARVYRDETLAMEAIYTERAPEIFSNGHRVFYKIDLGIGEINNSKVYEEERGIAYFKMNKPVTYVELRDSNSNVVADSYKGVINEPSLLEYIKKQIFFDPGKLLKVDAQLKTIDVNIGIYHSIIDNYLNVYFFYSKNARNSEIEEQLLSLRSNILSAEQVKDFSLIIFGNRDGNNVGHLSVLLFIHDNTEIKEGYALLDFSIGNHQLVNEQGIFANPVVFGDNFARNIVILNNLGLTLQGPNGCATCVIGAVRSMAKRDSIDNILMYDKSNNRPYLQPIIFNEILEYVEEYDDELRKIADTEYILKNPLNSPLNTRSNVKFVRDLNFEEYVESRGYYVINKRNSYQFLNELNNLVMNCGIRL